MLQLIHAGADLETALSDDAARMFAASSGASKEEQEVIAEHAIGATALMLVASTGNTEAVLALLNAGAKLEAKNQYGETALMIAAYTGNPETVTLLDRGADCNAIAGEVNYKFNYRHSCMRQQGGILQPCRHSLMLVSKSNKINMATHSMLRQKASIIKS